MVAKKNTKIKPWKKLLISLVVVALIFVTIMGINLYKQIFAPNIQVNKDKDQFVYIPTGSTFFDVQRILHDHQLLRSNSSFQWVAERMGYTKKIKPGRYRIKRGMNNKELITLLRSGRQTPVKVTFHNVRTIFDLCGVVGSQLEADSFSLANLLTNPAFLKQNQLNTDNVLTTFIPNTYEFYWNTSATQFFDRMQKEYTKFWTSQRLKKANLLGLTTREVSILASIVEKETTRDDEKPVIAGVYLNRIKKGWKLEADPTLVFALGDFTIRRVLNEHKEIDSPYNTYMYEGLPPGPICLPSTSSINAVLDYRLHQYMFFCAKDDFSGYHAFASTYAKHLLNARRFQKELNRRNIRS